MTHGKKSNIVSVKGQSQVQGIGFKRREEEAISKK